MLTKACVTNICFEKGVRHIIKIQSHVAALYNTVEDRYCYITFIAKNTLFTYLFVYLCFTIFQYAVTIAFYLRSSIYH